MSVGERIAALSNRFTLRIRHPDAFRVTDSAVAEGDFEGLRGHKYCLLVTFRRSGESVPTPIWFGLADGKVYMHSEANVGKVKRIRNDPRVLVGPCTVRGRPLGPMIEGSARIVPGEEEAHAEAVLQGSYGLGRRMYEGMSAPFGVETLYLEVSPRGAGE